MLKKQEMWRTGREGMCFDKYLDIKKWKYMFFGSTTVQGRLVLDVSRSNTDTQTRVISPSHRS